MSNLVNFLTALAFLAGNAVAAQGASHPPADTSVEAVKKQINSVKKNPDKYIYAEVTTDTPEEARNLAEEILWEEINSWAATQKKLNASSSLLVKKVSSAIEEMSLPRGNMYRSFLYVKKSDITDGDQAEIIANKSYTPSEADGGMKAEATSAPPAVPPAIAELMKITDYAAFAAHLKELKAQGKVASYARYASLSKPELYYLAVYNREGAVVAFLSPGEQRVNLATGGEDSVSNYAGCGAIGITLP